MQLIRTEKETLLSLLRISGPLPFSLLKAWFSRVYDTELTIGLIKDMAKKNYIFFDEEKSYCYLYSGQKINESSERCFYVMIKMLSQDLTIKLPANVVRASFPFDYIFVLGEKEYLIIDFEHNGEQKLRILNSMDKEYSIDNGFIPVIAKLRDNESFDKCDDNGVAVYKPKCDYILASLVYNIKLQEGGRYRAIFTEFKGETK